MISGLALRGPREAAAIACLMMLTAGVPVHDRPLSLDAGSPSWVEPADLSNPESAPPAQAASLSPSDRDLDALLYALSINALPPIFSDPDLAAWIASPADFYTELNTSIIPEWSTASSELLDADNSGAFDTTTLPEPQAVLLLAGGAVLLAIRRGHAN